MDLFPDPDPPEADPGPTQDEPGSHSGRAEAMPGHDPDVAQAAPPPLPAADVPAALDWLRARLRVVARFRHEDVGPGEGFAVPEDARRLAAGHWKYKAFAPDWAGELFKGGKYRGE